MGPLQDPLDITCNAIGELEGLTDQIAEGGEPIRSVSTGD
jgi:hypothetical protein